MLVAGVAVLAVDPGAARAADTTDNPIVGLAPTAGGDGYWQVTSRGAVYSYGKAQYKGGAGALALKGSIVGMARSAGSSGYWLVGADGGVFAYGDAGFYGSASKLQLRQPVVGMAATPTGRGYWLVAADGGIFAYGDAGFFGSAGSLRLNQPVVGMAATPTGRGYWLVAADGGIFAYGDAGFFGSAGSLRLNQPVVGMAATPTGRGYWLVAADGGIFAYGDAGFFGSAGNLKLNQPVVGMARTASGRGYWMVAADGGIFAYGDAAFHGRVTYTRPAAPTGYRYVLPAGAAKSSLTAAHHDYAALDIAVPVGTPYYAITAGTVTRLAPGGGCGLGIVLQGYDGVQYTYCHGSSQGVATGARVAPGQQLGLSGNTGHSSGPHLHLQIRYPGVLRCPQPFVSALAAGRSTPDVRGLPTTGCSYRS
ncbi:hypothetical protein GCM10027087_03610 [Paractinoplanes abujensis]